MDRITVAMVVVATAAVFSGMVPGRAFAEAPRFVPAAASPAADAEATPRGARVIALLLALEALRTTPVGPAIR